MSTEDITIAKLSEEENKRIANERNLAMHHAAKNNMFVSLGGTTKVGSWVIMKEEGFYWLLAMLQFPINEELTVEKIDEYAKAIKVDSETNKRPMPESYPCISHTSEEGVTALTFGMINDVFKNYESDARLAIVSKDTLVGDGDASEWMVSKFIPKTEETTEE